MRLKDALAWVAGLSPDSFQRLNDHLDQGLIDQALRVSGRVTLRRRRLPAERMVWLVIGLALFRDSPIWHVAQQLQIVLPGGQPFVTPSAIVQARKRLGPAPLSWLFERLSQYWAQSAERERWRGLQVLGVDGAVFRLPDSAANAAGYARGRSQHGASAWPQLRLVCLMELTSHLLLAARFGSYAVGELTLAQGLLAKVPTSSLTIFDRNFFSGAFLFAWGSAPQRHWLVRLKSGPKFRLLKPLGAGDALVEVKTSPRARKAQPDLPAHWQARLITASVRGKPVRFLTSLTDAHAYPAQEILALYRQRWEIELGFREIKQNLLQGAPVLRSKHPDLVEQELYGTLIAYNLLRHEMAGLAQELGVTANALSFQCCSLAIVNALLLLPLQTPGAVPKHLASLRTLCKNYVLSQRRPRLYPRTVKPIAAKYPRRRPTIPA